MKIFLTVLATLFSLAATAGIAFVVVIVLAGPHSDILPTWLQGIVLMLGWAAVIGIPILVGKAAWRRLHRA